MKKQTNQTITQLTTPRTSCSVHDTRRLPFLESCIVHWSLFNCVIYSSQHLAFNDNECPFPISRIGNQIIHRYQHLQITGKISPPYAREATIGGMEAIARGIQKKYEWNLSGKNRSTNWRGWQENCVSADCHSQGYVEERFRGIKPSIFDESKRCHTMGLSNVRWEGCWWKSNPEKIGTGSI